MPHDVEMTAARDCPSASAMSALLQFFYLLGRSCLVTAFRQFPVAALLCTAGCLAVSVPMGLFLGWRSAPTIMLWSGLGIGSATAGLLWGAHRTFRHVVVAGLTMVEAHAPRFIQELFTPLRHMGDGGLPRVPIAQLRTWCQESVDLPLQLGFQGGWSAPFARLATVAARWSLRAELAAVRHVLTSFERRGETEITIDAVQRLVCSHSLEQIGRMVRATVWQVDLVIAVLVFTCLAAPAGWLFWIR